MRTIDEEYRATIKQAVIEASAEVAFQYSGGDAASHAAHAAGHAIFNYRLRIAEIVTNRLALHYSHTRKAKSQRKVET